VDTVGIGRSRQSQSRKRKIWSRYQSKDKRVRIADLHREAAARATAAELVVAGQYRPCTAQRLAAGRRAGSGRDMTRSCGSAT
jgi:hypothetical protein